MSAGFNSSLPQLSYFFGSSKKKKERVNIVLKYFYLFVLIYFNKICIAFHLEYKIKSNM